MNPVHLPAAGLRLLPCTTAEGLLRLHCLLAMGQLSALVAVPLFS